MRERARTNGNPGAPVLRFTVEGADEFHDRVEAKLAEIERRGVPVREHVRSFGTVSQLRRVLTDRRVELVETILRTEPESIIDLAERVERATGDVHDDLHVLANGGIVRFERDDRRMRPTIPYERVRIDVTLPRVDDEGGETELPV